MLMMMVMVSNSNSASYNWGGDHLRRAGASVEWRAQWPLLRSNIDHTTNYTRIHRRLKYILLLWFISQLQYYILHGFAFTCACVKRILFRLLLESGNWRRSNYQRSKKMIHIRPSERWDSFGPRLNTSFSTLGHNIEGKESVSQRTQANTFHTQLPLKDKLCPYQITDTEHVGNLVFWYLISGISSDICADIKYWISGYPMQGTRYQVQRVKSIYLGLGEQDSPLSTLGQRELRW